ncbi:MAG: tripartite tricarboxylate transporter substrate binding protein, partial [Verrucomicrobia bacterium]|nr:tripartite tricarboxylate transporter substrate binding protein [Verrucomicrobiota bacterium]
DFVAQLRARPGDFNYGSGGNGTILHLATELYLEAAGAKARHIPYKGVGPMVTDLLGGQVDFATAALPSVQGLLGTGKLRAIGVFAAQRTPAAPAIPTLAEQGLANFEVEAWFGVIGPKGLSPATVKKVHDAVTTAFADPAVKEAMAKQGNTIRIGTTEQAQAAFRSELAKYAALVKKVGLEPQ